MLARTKSEATARGDEHYFTGITCKNGHLTKRVASSGHCLGCVKAKADRDKAWRIKHKKPRTKFNANEFDAGLTILCCLAEYEDALTATDIADVCGCTSQHIYDIEKRALEKLTAMANNPLRDFID